MRIHLLNTTKLGSAKAGTGAASAMHVVAGHPAGLKKKQEAGSKGRYQEGCPGRNITKTIETCA